MSSKARLYFMLMIKLVDFIKLFKSSLECCRTLLINHNIISRQQTLYFVKTAFDISYGRYESLKD